MPANRQWELQTTYSFLFSVNATKLKAGLGTIASSIRFLDIPQEYDYSIIFLNIKIMTKRMIFLKNGFQKSLFKTLRKKMVLNIHLPHTVSSAAYCQVLCLHKIAPHTELPQALLPSGFWLDLANKTHKQEFRGWDVNFRMRCPSESSRPHCNGDRVLSHDPASRHLSSPACVRTTKAWAPCHTPWLALILPTTLHIGPSLLLFFFYCWTLVIVAFVSCGETNIWK